MSHFFSAFKDSCKGFTHLTKISLICHARKLKKPPCLSESYSIKCLIIFWKVNSPPPLWRDDISAPGEAITELIAGDGNCGTNSLIKNLICIYLYLICVLFSFSITKCNWHSMGRFHMNKPSFIIVLGRCHYWEILEPFIFWLGIGVWFLVLPHTKITASQAQKDLGSRQYMCLKNTQEDFQHFWNIWYFSIHNVVPLTSIYYSFLV